jgi:hypothetical protein
MEIRRIIESDIPKLIAFGERVFPKRVSYYHTIVEFLQKGRIGGYTGGMVLVDNDEVCGQIFSTATTMWYKGVPYSSGWLYDFIVREDLRKDVWGIDLLMKARKEFGNACSLGANPRALNMNLKLGSKMLGELRKYVGPSSLLMFPLYFVLPTDKNYPDLIDGFRLISRANDVVARDFTNYDLLESGRNQDFISWRFFTKEYKNYKFYQKSDGDYFVVRLIKYRGVRLLALVDYRCDIKSIDSFTVILSVVKSIAKKMHIPFILCGSSHNVIDTVLEHAHFSSIGRPRPITTASKYKGALDVARINNRDFTLVTLTDSDGEVSW